MGLISENASSASNRLAEAVAIDVSEAFARFTAAHANEPIVAIALCSVDDAAPPYIMGATMDDIGPIIGTDDSFKSEPPDWSWNDGGKLYRFDSIIDEMLHQQPDSFEEHGRDIFEGIVEGLRRFDASGEFKGQLPREQMLLLLWINDPSRHNAQAMVKWVAQMNPASVSRWFTAVFPYA